MVSFVSVTSHKGEYIAKSLKIYLIEWGVKNIFCVTLDNASSNGAVITTDDGVQCTLTGTEAAGFELSCLDTKRDNTEIYTKSLSGRSATS